MLETEGRHMALGEEEGSEVAQTLVAANSSRKMMQEQTEKDQHKAIKIIVDNSKSSQHLLDNAYVHVEEDWTNEVGVEDFPGNIYSIAACMLKSSKSLAQTCITLPLFKWKKTTRNFLFSQLTSIEQLLPLTRKEAVHNTFCESSSDHNRQASLPKHGGVANSQ